MTKMRTRRRRKPDPASLDDPAMAEAERAWFAGEDSTPWSALLEPWNSTLEQRWAAWLERHPGAVEPEDLQSLIRAAKK